MTGGVMKTNRDEEQTEKIDQRGEKNEDVLRLNPTSSTPLYSSIFKKYIAIVVNNLTWEK